MIQSNEIETLPSRETFKDGDVDLSGKVPVLFFPCDICDDDSWSYGRSKYDLRLYGTLANGEKACIHLDGAPVYFDYDISAHNTDWRLSEAQFTRERVRAAEDEGLALMRAHLGQHNQSANVTELRAVWLYPLQGFTLEKHLYIRVLFASLFARGACLRAMRDVSTALVTANDNLFAHDDTGYSGNPAYFNAIAREYHFATAGWNQFATWRAHSRVDAHAIHDFVVPIEQFVLAPPEGAESISRMRDRLIVESWDIEVENEMESADIPHAGDKYTITTISLVYSYVWSESPLVCYVLTLYPSLPANPRDFAEIGANEMKVIFVACATERELLLARAQIAHRMQPDIRIAFNGANFDWLLYNDKVARYEIQDEVLKCLDLSYTPAGSRVADKYRRKFSHMNVKVGAGNFHECAQIALLAGTVDLDIMPTMRKIYKNEEVKFAQSLNKYLEKARLPPKNDIYFKVMLRMFRRARALSDPEVPRECHCAHKEACSVCNSARVREIDYATDGTATAAPMREWVYRDGHDGREIVLRDARLEKCCACGARPINEADIARVNTYCAVDSVRPLQLLRKLGVITDNRELANATYTALSDAFLRADGMRVLNFICSLSRDFEIAVTARPLQKPRAFYKGGHVFMPALGVHHRPVTALDFSSLYPSLMLAYNISPDTIVASREAADQLVAMGYNLHEIKEFKYEVGEKKGANDNVHGTARGWSVRHGGILAPNRDPAAATVTYDEQGVEHRGRAALAREHISLLGAALRFLLDSRRAVRADMGRMEAQIKALLVRAIGPTAKTLELDMEGLDAQLRARACPRDCAEEIARIELRWKCYKSKQLALKVLANTFYGQMGSCMSPCYSLIAAEGVTAAGRYNIKRVAAYLRELGYTIEYGDTDSVYMCSPERIYADLDAEWARGEMTLEAYWGKQVIAARADMDALKPRVTAFLRAENGTQFLNMAYEEVGMPTAFFGKKKYILRPHIKGVTFGARPMVRGIDTIKQGHAIIERMIGNTIIEDILAVRADVNVLAIVEARIAEYYSRDNIDLAQFVRYKTYKSNKRNAAVLRFVERMRARYTDILAREGAAAAEPYAPPDDGDKFPFVIAVRAREVSMSGHCVSYAIGDRMEYPHAITSGRAQLDRQYYMNGALMSLFARFASCDAQFAPENDVARREENYREYDEYRQSHATTYLQAICERYNPSENTARIRAVASCQRSTVNAFRDLVRSAAQEIGVCLDARVANLLVHDRTRELCAGQTGDGISDDMIDALTDLICEIASARVDPATIIAEAEMIESYAGVLSRQYKPQELAQKYARANFNSRINAPIAMARDSARAEIKATHVPRLIALYRKNAIDRVLSGIATNAADRGEKGKTKLMPEVGRKCAFNARTIEVLGALGKVMASYSAASRDLRREAAMRDRFATDALIGK
jgi:DNA polymerase elongation subunit (family B)